MKAQLNIELLPSSARTVFIFEDSDLPNFNLLSVAQLTNNGMKVIFFNNHATIEDMTGHTVATTTRDQNTNLYFLNPTQQKHYMTVMFPKSANIKERTSFYVAAMGSPTSKTLKTAIEKKILSLPGLLSKHLSKHPHSVATNKGHLDHTRKGLDSTNKTKKATSSQPVLSHPPINDTLFIDITGRFTHKSTRNMQYLLVMRCSNSNYIHIETLTSRKSNEITRGFLQGLYFFKEHGIQHKHVRMDNERSREFENTLKEHNLTIQFISPESHRMNAAERDIRTFKNHFISVLATADKDFPLSEWDLLLPQTELTLNLMRESHQQPKKSAWTHLHGEYDFDRNPIAPPGTKVLIYETPQVRPTWSPHGLIGFYVGPAMQHYRSYNILVKETNRIRVSDSVAWHPESEKQGIASNYDFELNYSEKLTSLPQHVNPDNISTNASSSSVISPFNSSEVIPPSTPTSTTTASVSNNEQHQKYNITTRNSNRRRTSNTNTVHFAGSSLTYKAAMKGGEKMRWIQAANEEFDRLITETQTMKFIEWNQKPHDRKASYYNPQVKIKHRNDSSIEYRVRGTYGGDVSDYTGPTAAKTADLVTIKILLNAVVSENAKFMTLDIKDFYLGSPMPNK